MFFDDFLPKPMILGERNGLLTRDLVNPGKLDEISSLYFVERNALGLGILFFIVALLACPLFLFVIFFGTLGHPGR